jgi:hypothetical protein
MCQARVLEESCQIAKNTDLAEEAAEEAAERSNAGAGGHHDVGVVRVLLRKEHNLAGRASELDLIASLGVAEVVRADTLLGRILLAGGRVGVGSTADAEGGGLAGLVVTIASGGDRVEADAIRLVLLRVNARGENAIRLTLPVRELT